MAKGTIIFLFILTTIASLLFGINIGKKIGNNRTIEQSNNLQITISPSPTLTTTPTPITSPSASLKKTSGTTTYTDQTCGFTFFYPGSFIKQKSVNQQSTILTDPDNPSAMIAATCAASIPRPPVSSDKIESIMLDKVPATLYHDQNAQDGSPRDEVIAKHPTNGMEIIIAGYGETFQQVLVSFRFLMSPK